MCGLHFLSRDFGGMLQGHKPSGCIFDHTYEKQYYRIPISNPKLCFPCKDRLEDLERKIEGQADTQVSLCENVDKVLSMKWMGAPEQRNSPLYNLKRNYRYDVDRNSGFNKTRFEKFMDSIEDSSKKWIVGVMIAIVGALILNLLHIK